MRYNSIVNDYDLNRDDAASKFEDLIATGATMKDIALCFGVSYQELCDWVVKEYKHPQAEFTYMRLQKLALQSYLGVLSDLAQHGNPSAISALNTYIHKLGGGGQPTKIVFEGTVRTETEEDKKDGD